MIQNILKTIRGQAKSVADLERALGQIDIPGLEADADKLEGDRRIALLDGTDKDVELVERKIEVANREVERAYAAKAELERRIEQARNSEADQDKVARYQAAKAQADAAAKALAKEYPEIGRKFVTLIKTVIEARTAIEQANQNLPDGVSPLLDPEFAVRGRHGEPERTLKTEEVALWCYANSSGIQVLPPEKQLELDARFKGSDQGTVSSDSSGGHTSVVRRRLTKRSYLPASQTERPDSILTIKMPGLKIGDVPFWQALPYSDLGSVRANLDKIASMRPAPAVNDSEIRIEYHETTSADPAMAEAAE
ncbi:hypothetical protein FJW04_21910 [Mesorhizobium sp. B2-7-3]|uniref:hypothetical protein n=1 Tax=unclassified Mesorhizobium TaxID=325217 RepID=UPI00112BE53B|nr:MULTISPECIES: hypothetical protein [unclassified Mesorhizobium]MBZ9927756.1 hypothetical protein [Mesorhizobium sp. BR1-1-4]TPJ12915.1 hypothetical protein FJW04_21910 [Mesorhizobium sp. B2-7-3]